MPLPFTGLLRLASRVVCLIVIASFVIFAVEQASKASTHQQAAVSGTAANATASAPPAQEAKPAQESAVHKAIDEAASELTSPFSGVTAGSTSQWVVRGVGTLLALLVYGLGLGYLLRLLRIRV
jgi:hypothetical protein